MTQKNRLWKGKSYNSKSNEKTKEKENNDFKRMVVLELLKRQKQNRLLFRAIIISSVIGLLLGMIIPFLISIMTMILVVIGSIWVKKTTNDLEYLSRKYNFPEFFPKPLFDLQSKRENMIKYREGN